MEEPVQIDSWRRISVLGSGAFGTVSLWRNCDTNDTIAIKKCKFQLASNLTKKQRERWQNEVEIMKGLSHPNIIYFKELPQELEQALSKHNPTKLPLLSMEYCTEGNLRNVLRQVRNVCGLPETEVRAVLGDISSAVSYLHKRNITHRDIKPDNIVLQKTENCVIYKLIDLGYAKELNGTVSFVGTLHYLAPEIMSGLNYDYTVDYWSLGTLAFEIICGLLPFIPQYTPFERFKFIKSKEPDHICIFLNNFGNISHSSKLFKENQISSCLQQEIEIWLRRLLQYDPQERSKLFAGDVNAFNHIRIVLEKRILWVFSVYTFEFYSYEVSEGTLVGTLKKWIARDTKVDMDDQVLVTDVLYLQVKNDEFVENIVGEQQIIYVFKKGAFKNKENYPVPKYINLLMGKGKEKVKWRELRPIYIKSFFYITQETRLVNAFIGAFELFIIYVKNTVVKFKNMAKQIHQTLSHLLLKLQCYIAIRNNNCTLLNYSQNCNSYLTNFKRLIASLDRCILNTNKLMKKVLVLERRQYYLDRFSAQVTTFIRNCNIGTNAQAALSLLERRNDEAESLSCSEMFKIVSETLRAKDKLLINEMFENYAKATSVALRDLEILIVWIGQFQEHIQNLSKALDDNETERFKILLRDNNKLVNGCEQSDYNFDGIISENETLWCILPNM